jgi:peptide/nickel transport system substrate-binding protein
MFRGSDVLKNPASQTTPITQGPFQLAKWVRATTLSWSATPTMDQGQPYLDRIIIKIIPEASARLLALRAGEVDYIDQYYFPLSAHDILAKDPRFSLKEVSYPSVDLIILNTRKPPLDQAKVRQALLTAIDRNYLLKNVFLGTGQVGRSIIDTRLAWTYNPAVDYEKLYAYDAKRAAALLDEAGFKPGPDGTRITLRLSFDTGRPEYTSLAQALQRYWQAAGIKTVLEGAERPVVLKRVYSDYDFDATLQNYSTSGDPALGISRTYHTEAIMQGQSFNNATGYPIRRWMRCSTKRPRCTDRRGRRVHYFAVQEVLARDLPVLTIHQQAQIGVSGVQLRDQWKAANYRGGIRYGWRNDRSGHRA